MEEFQEVKTQVRVVAPTPAPYLTQEKFDARS
jgi:hypothetical protein